jgi:hypothetical protein
MAVTKARNENPVSYNLNTGTGKVEEVHRGASGGVAPEGYGLANLITQGSTLGGVENARVENEGVTQRGKENDDKRFQAAQKFMKSKQEFDKKILESEKAVEKGEFDKNSAKEALVKQQEKQNKEADKKPTAPGVETQLDNPLVAQSAEVTTKEEKADVAQSAVLSATNPKEAEQKKKDAEKAEKDLKKAQEVKK